MQQLVCLPLSNFPQASDVFSPQRQVLETPGLLFASLQNRHRLPAGQLVICSQGCRGSTGLPAGYRFWYSYCCSLSKWIRLCFHSSRRYLQAKLVVARANQSAYALTQAEDTCRPSLS